MELVGTADRLVDELEGLVRALPGGRGGLRSALAGTGAEWAEREERDARRAAFNAWCLLQGLRVDAGVYRLILTPGSKPHTFHQAMVNGQIGIRRMRAGPPVTVGGFLGSALLDAAPTRVALSGADLRTDPRAVLLPEFCGGPIDRLRVERDGRAYRLCLDPEHPPLDDPMSVVFGVKQLDFVHERANARFAWAGTRYVVPRPTRLMVLDVLVPRGAFAGVAPRVTFTMEPEREPDPLAGPPPDGHEELRTASRLRPMGVGLETRGTAAADAFNAITARALELLGHEAAEFDRYRLEIEFPLAFVGMRVWFKLVEPGMAASPG